MLYMTFAQAGAPECVGHAGFHHFSSARGPGALLREARVNQLGSQGSRNAYDRYRKNEGEQNMTLEEVLPEKAADERHLLYHVVHDFGWSKHSKKKISKNNMKFQPPKNVSEQKQFLTVIRF